MRVARQRVGLCAEIERRGARGIERQGAVDRAERRFVLSAAVLTRADITNPATASAVASSVLLAIVARACSSAAALVRLRRTRRARSTIHGTRRDARGRRRSPGPVGAPPPATAARSWRLPAFEPRRGARREDRDRRRRGFRDAFAASVRSPTAAGSVRRCRPPVGDLILQVEDVLQRAVKFVGPKMRPGFGFEQLRCDPHAIPALRTPPSST